MAKPVQLSDEAYRRLQMRKRPGESFSDVVLRLARKGSLADLGRHARPPQELAAHLAEIRRIDRMDPPRVRHGRA